MHCLGRYLSGSVPEYLSRYLGRYLSRYLGQYLHWKDNILPHKLLTINDFIVNVILRPR